MSVEKRNEVIFFYSGRNPRSIGLSKINGTLAVA